MNYKQEMFIEYIIQGYNHRTAYILAFPEAKDKKPSSNDEKASILFHRPEIHAYFEKRRKENLDKMAEKAVWNKERAINELVDVLEQNKQESKRQEESWLDELSLYDKQITELEKQQKKPRCGKKLSAELQAKIDQCRWAKIQCTKRYKNSKSNNDAILQSIQQLNSVMDNFKTISVNDEENAQTQLQILFGTDIEKGLEQENEKNESGTVQD